jgi:hypothetical protein
VTKIECCGKDCKASVVFVSDSLTYEEAMAMKKDGWQSFISFDGPVTMCPVCSQKVWDRVSANDNSIPIRDLPPAKVGNDTKAVIIDLGTNPSDEDFKSVVDMLKAKYGKG